jgi:hypothetical protein
MGIEGSLVRIFTDYRYHRKMVNIITLIFQSITVSYTKALSFRCISWHVRHTHQLVIQEGDGTITTGNTNTSFTCQNSRTKWWKWCKRSEMAYTVTMVYLNSVTVNLASIPIALACEGRVRRARFSL